MIHIICENVTSICVALSFIYMEESDNMVAIVSLISSIIMTFCMVFTVGCVLIFTNKTKSLHSANVRILLDRDKFTDSNPSKRKIKRAIKSIMADSSCVSCRNEKVVFMFYESVNVWYLCKLPRHYEIHVFLQTYKVGLKLHEKDIKRMISKTFKGMDLSIRRSIQISSAEIAGVMNSNYFSRISDKVPATIVCSYVMLLVILISMKKYKIFAFINLSFLANQCIRNLESKHHGYKGTSRYGAFGPVFFVGCARLESYSDLKL